MGLRNSKYTKIEGASPRYVLFGSLVYNSILSVVLVYFAFGIFFIFMRFGKHPPDPLLVKAPLFHLVTFCLGQIIALCFIFEKGIDAHNPHRLLPRQPRCFKIPIEVFSQDRLEECLRKLNYNIISRSDTPDSIEITSERPSPRRTRWIKQNAVIVSNRASVYAELSNNIWTCIIVSSPIRFFVVNDSANWIYSSLEEFTEAMDWSNYRVH